MKEYQKTIFGPKDVFTRYKWVRIKRSSKHYLHSVPPSYPASTKFRRKLLLRGLYSFVQNGDERNWSLRKFELWASWVAEVQKRPERSLSSGLLFVHISTTCNCSRSKGQWRTTYCKTIATNLRDIAWIYYQPLSYANVHKNTDNIFFACAGLLGIANMVENTVFRGWYQPEEKMDVEEQIWGLRNGSKLCCWWLALPLMTDLVSVTS